MTNAPEEPTPDDAKEDLASAIEEGFPLLAGRDGTRFDRVVDGFLVLSGTLVLLAALAVAMNVTSRAFGRTYTWVFEYSELSVVFIVFLAVAGVARSDGHVRMDLIDEFLPDRARLRLTVATDALGALIALLLTAAAAWVTYQDLRTGATIGLLSTPRWIPIAVVTVGSAVLCVEQLRAVRRAHARLP